MTDNPFNPFANFDVSKFDLSKFDMTKMLGDVRIPGFDMQAVMAAQRKNIEALTAANQAAVQGMQAVAQRQAEILSQAMGEVSSIAQQLASSVSNPQEITTKQAELAGKGFEQALANMRELAESVSKSNAEAFTIINKRVTESLKELKQHVVALGPHGPGRGEKS
jgi:phasin family protein